MRGISSQQPAIAICLLEDAQANLDNCSENLVSDSYAETYFGVPRAGWSFHRWGNYCVTDPGNECAFNVPAGLVARFDGLTVPPLQAIFRPTVNTGLDSLFIGHSFFDPFSQGMIAHAATAGFVDHTQHTYFSGGATGAPEALWNNASKRAVIQGYLDAGDIELFGMTYHPSYPNIDGYRNWVDYALQQNPDTRFFIGLPWVTNPGSFTPAFFSVLWQNYHPGVSHVLIDTLRAEYPGVDFYCIPYGQAAAELYTLYGAGNLPDVDTLVSSSGDAIFRDSFGHADDILVDLGRLVWLSAIYGVDMSTYSHDPGYTTDLKAIAQSIMADHDPNYDAP